jgi:SAM-dependent methyltransferase
VLHQEAGVSYYTEYRSLAERARAYFDRGDLGSLTSLLSGATKYRFILNQLERVARGSRVLEIGCSRGYLAAYCILAGLDVLGVDASAEAIAGARAAFGDRFVLPDSEAIEAGAPYDVIYHVGTIGCVADPIAFTKGLLALLKPNGRLLFNAPNREACGMRNQLWFDSAPPPDVVTLYPPGFWRRQFSDVAHVREGVEFLDAERSFSLAVSRGVRAWRAPRRRSLQANEDVVAWDGGTSDRLRRWFERRASHAGHSLGLSQFTEARPSEYGLFVVMRPKAGGA